MSTGGCTKALPLLSQCKLSNTNQRGSEHLSCLPRGFHRPVRNSTDTFHSVEHPCHSCNQKTHTGYKHWSSLVDELLPDLCLCFHAAARALSPLHKPAMTDLICCLQTLILQCDKLCTNTDTTKVSVSDSLQLRQKGSPENHKLNELFFQMIHTENVIVDC